MNERRGQSGMNQERQASLETRPSPAATAFDPSARAGETTQRWIDRQA